jgi:hypothetical protein
VTSFEEIKSNKHEKATGNKITEKFIDIFELLETIMTTWTFGGD